MNETTDQYFVAVDLIHWINVWLWLSQIMLLFIIRSSRTYDMRQGVISPEK